MMLCLTYCQLPTTTRHLLWKSKEASTVRLSKLSVGTELVGELWPFTACIINLPPPARAQGDIIGLLESIVDC
jgi:hypothetical protein